MFASCNIQILCTDTFCNGYIKNKLLLGRIQLCIFNVDSWQLKDLNTTHPRFWAELSGFWVATQSVHFKGVMSQNLNILGLNFHIDKMFGIDYHSVYWEWTVIKAPFKSHCQAKKMISEGRAVHIFSEKIHFAQRDCKRKSRKIATQYLHTWLIFKLSDKRETTDISSKNIFKNIIRKEDMLLAQNGSSDIRLIDPYMQIYDIELKMVVSPI